MQADIDLSNLNIEFSASFLDDNHLTLMFLGHNIKVRFLINRELLEQAINLSKLISSNSLSASAKKNDSPFKIDVTLKAIDLRIVTTRRPFQPELRWYTGKKRKHGLNLVLSWDQLTSLIKVMENVVKETPVV